MKESFRIHITSADSSDLYTLINELQELSIMLKDIGMDIDRQNRIETLKGQIERYQKDNKPDVARLKVLLDKAQAIFTRGGIDG